MEPKGQKTDHCPTAEPHGTRPKHIHTECVISDLQSIVMEASRKKRFEIGQILHLKFEIRNMKLHGRTVPRPLIPSVMSDSAELKNIQLP
jgi:hypothetical protein